MKTNMKRIEFFLQAVLFSAFFIFISSCATSKKTVPVQNNSQHPLSLEMKDKRSLVGQMVMIGIPGYKLTDADRRIFRDYKIGNVILFKWNVKNAMQLRKLTLDIQKEVFANTGKKALIFVDQEGGRVSRFSRDIEKMPSALNLSEYGSEELVYTGSVATGKQLQLVGINANFAPVNDIFSNPANKVIGDRSYGRTAEDVIRFSTLVMKALDESGIVACAKHFPGHGDTILDSHHALPIVYKTYEELKSFELKPFEASIKNGIPMIMTAHILFPKIDNEFPATMSEKILTGILRKDMGFDGVIVTDSLEMNAIKDRYGIVNGAVHSIQAGADMVCLIRSEQYVIDVLEALCHEISQERLMESVQRILKVKQKLRNDVHIVSAKDLKRKIKAENEKVKAIRILVEN